MEPGILGKTCSLGVYAKDDQVYRRNRKIIVNALTDLFGASTVTALSTELGALPADAENGFNFEKLVDSTTESHVEAYMGLAFAAAARLAASPQSLNPYFARACSVTADLSSNACLRNLITNLGLRLFGRPLSGDETAAIERVYAATVGTNGEKLEAVLAVFLQDPRFLYRDLSVGDRNFVIADELARLIWQSVPDATLAEAAAKGELATEEGVRAQVKRMLADGKSTRVLLGFFKEWLHYADIPEFEHGAAFLSGIRTAGLREAMIQEYDDFLLQTVVEKKGTYRDLLVSREAKVNNASLAQIYGVSPSDQWLTLPEERAGILTRAAVLASGRDAVNPIMRGVHVTKDILCNVIPVPPGEVIDMRPLDIDYLQLSTRVYNDQRTSGGSCIGCHSMINPVGHGLGNFDALGRFTTVDRIYGPGGAVANQFPVDALVNLPLDSALVPVDGAGAMSALVAGSAQGAQCFSKQMYRFLAGRQEAGLSCGMSAVSRLLQSGTPVLSVLENLLVTEMENLK